MQSISHVDRLLLAARGQPRSQGGCLRPDRSQALTPEHERRPPGSAPCGKISSCRLLHSTVPTALPTVPGFIFHIGRMWSRVTCTRFAQFLIRKIIKNRKNGVLSRLVM